MKTPPPTTEKLLSIRDQLHGERASIQIVGRALTPEELKRLEVLNAAIGYLDAAVKVLKDGVKSEKPVLSVALKDGMYLLDSEYLYGELRVDIQDTNVISLDLFNKHDSGLEYLASVRTSPGAELKEKQKVYSIICEDKASHVATGTMTFFPASETQTTLEIILNDAIEGLAANTQVLLDAKWENSLFRKIALETEVEENIEENLSYDFNGKEVTLLSCFAEVGIQIEKFSESDTIPANDKWDDSQLHALMTQFADATINKEDWILHMLLLSKSRLDGLFGVMFDTGVSDVNGFPRQGAAIFMKEIEKYTNDIKRKSIQTQVHELGHALNLAHRFEREIGRADSTSFMNYDWRYLGGGKRDEFWENFKFTFDKDEIRFMRHAPWWKLIPGGAEFHTVKYWNEGTGGYSPYAPEIPLSDLELVITPPQQVPLFEFASPVYLEATLTNKSKRNYNIPEFYLDPKSGVLEIVVKRLSGNAQIINSQSFNPIVSRCFDIDAYNKDVLKPNKSISNNINLTFGSSGFTFAEPGNYEITAILSLWANGYNYIVRSNSLSIRIAYPKDAEEEKDALKIFTKDVGYYLTLGGSDLFPEAQGDLQEIKEKRMKRDKAIVDPLVAYITRCQAINLSREFVTFKKGKFSKRSKKTDEVLKLLDELKANESKIFDKSTLKVTQDLSKSIMK